MLQSSENTPQFAAPQVHDPYPFASLFAEKFTFEEVKPELDSQQRMIH